MQNSKLQFKIQKFSPEDLKKLYIPPPDSHKGQNGKLLIVGGSHLFHGASLWALKVASRIVDMVFYASTRENNELTQKLKSELYDFIAVSRGDIESYIEESDCVLIGPGLPRKEGQEVGDDDTKELTETLLKKYPHKKWVIDGGSLQVIDPSIIPHTAIVTPHQGEFQKLFGQEATEQNVSAMAKKYGIVILTKGQEDIVCLPFDSAQGETCVQVSGGNAGMTKGGTGDVLAGLVAALYCKNEAFLAAKAASYINKKAGDELSKHVGPYYNASDLCDEIPRVMKKFL